MAERLRVPSLPREVQLGAMNHYPCQESPEQAHEKPAFNC